MPQPKLGPYTSFPRKRKSSRSGPWAMVGSVVSLEFTRTWYDLLRIAQSAMSENKKLTSCSADALAKGLAPLCKPL